MVEKLAGSPGETVSFSNVVLLLSNPDGTGVQVGKPTVAGAIVEGKITEHGLGKKVSVVKFKAKVRYKRRVGHRQQFTKIKIEKIAQ